MWTTDYLKRNTEASYRYFIASLLRIFSYKYDAKRSLTSLCCCSEWHPWREEGVPMEYFLLRKPPPTAVRELRGGVHVESRRKED